MKRYVLILGLLVAGFTSCKKTATPFNAAKQAAIDEAEIHDYISQQNLDSVQKDTSGVYYKIITHGTGIYPTTKSTVSVDYEGKLLNGTVFAPSSTAEAPLTNFITGWQYGIPHINTGGTILLIIPSRLGYGNSSPGAAIPENSVLVFTIKLIGFGN